MFCGLSSQRLKKMAFKYFIYEAFDGLVSRFCVLFAVGNAVSLN